MVNRAITLVLGILRWMSVRFKEQLSIIMSDILPPATKPIFGNVSFHNFNNYLSGACSAFAAAVVLVLMFLHATHYSHPQEQRKIIKIMFIVPYYCLFSWLSVLLPTWGPYLDPWLDVLQSIPLAIFFLLILEFVSGSENERQLFFAGLEIPNTTKGFGSKKTVETYDTAERRLQWYRNNWAAIFQYVPVSVGVAVASNITDAAGVYCPFGTTSFHFSKVYLEIISNLSVTIAVTAIFGLYRAIKTPLANHKPLHKLLCFKIVVFFGFVVSIIFLVLGFTKALDPTARLSYGDMKSLQPMILCIAMAPISVYFHYAYSWQEYRIGATHRPIRENNEGDQTEPEHYQGGFLGWKAFLQALSWMEVLRGIVFTFKMFSEFREERNEYAAYYESTASTELLNQRNSRYEPYDSRDLGA